MISMKVFITLLLSSLFFVGCTINQKKRFEKVQVGMDKDEVLRLLASPQITQRWHGMDRWTYIIYDDDVRLDKEVHFSEGKAVYAGDAYKPPLSAEQRDQKNEEANAEAEKLAKAQREENRKAYRQYEDSVIGTEAKPAYVPEFKPVQ